MVWTLSAGLFPMNITCVAHSGCVLSNVYKEVQEGLPSSEACFRLQANETAVVHLAYSVDSRDGLNVLFNPTTTDAEYPIGSGVFVTSEMACYEEVHCIQHIMIMCLMVAPGLTLANYVRTNNETEPEGWPSRLRQEWFLTGVDDGGAVTKERPCFAALAEGERAVMQQARIRLQPFFNVIDVTRDSFLLMLYGTCGGAFSTFLQLGTALVVACAFLGRYCGAEPDGGSGACCPHCGCPGGGGGGGAAASGEGEAGSGAACVAPPSKAGVLRWPFAAAKRAPAPGAITTAPPGSGIDMCVSPSHSDGPGTPGTPTGKAQLAAAPASSRPSSAASGWSTVPLMSAPGGGGGGGANGRGPHNSSSGSTTAHATPAASIRGVRVAVMDSPSAAATAAVPAIRVGEDAPSSRRASLAQDASLLSGSPALRAAWAHASPADSPRSTSSLLPGSRGGGRAQVEGPA